MIPTDLILGKNEYTINNNPITKTLIEIDISKGISIKSRKKYKNETLITIKISQNIDTIFQSFNFINKGINKINANNTNDKFPRKGLLTNKL